MRERAFSIREPARAAGDEAGFLRRHRPTWILATGGAALLAGVGAFGTGNAAPWTLFTYWFAVMFAGAFISAWAIDLFGLRHAAAERMLELGPKVLLVICVLVTPAIWVLAGTMLGGLWSPLRMLHILPQTFAVATPFLALQLVFERGQFGRPPSSAAEGEPPVAAPRDGAEPAFLRRLPPQHRRASILALQAEDHYLRVHLEDGSALILMPFTEAVEALDQVEGARTHRSWWVAREAVARVERGGGRAILHLANGLAVPVSRSYSAALRRAGWF